jgi:Holliday junction resolvase RusA-like endonuclease
MIVSFFIPGKPVAKGRPRVTKKGISYTPQKTRNYEALVKMLAIEAMKGKTPVDGPVVVEAVAVFPVPDSWPKWKKALAEMGDIAHTTKPDEDNVGKAISDAMNEVVYLDDQQVTRKDVRKRFETSAHRVGVRVTVKAAKGYPSQIKKCPGKTPTTAPTEETQNDFQL